MIFMFFEIFKFSVSLKFKKLQTCIKCSVLFDFRKVWASEQAWALKYKQHEKLTEQDTALRVSPRGNKVGGLPRAASFGRLFGHISRLTNSFWLRSCVELVLYHMQVWETTRHSRKFIGKSLRQGKVEHMSEHRDFEWAGGTFWCEIWCFRCAARTVEHEFEFLKWLVELVSKSNSIPHTRFRETAG